MKSTDIVTKKGGALMTTSKIIADTFGKTHRNVTRDIEALDCSDKFSTHNFEQSEYKTERGKTYKCYNITEHGFYMLAMGFTGAKAAEWKEQFLSEFARLQATELNVDTRMDSISIEMDNVKGAGQAWSKLGLEVKKRKKKVLEKRALLIDEVQLKLEY